MNNETQIERYKRLLTFIESNFKEDINTDKIESICYYSYRNINRIFEALHQETIGKYIKRIRLEKAAQYLKYSKISVSDIGYEVGFEDRAVFSKAFKKKYGCSPSAFRSDNELVLEQTRQAILEDENRSKLEHEIIFLPDFDYLFLEYRGDYKDLAAIEESSNQVYQYALETDVLTDSSVFMTEILDDSDISDSIHLRYHLGYVLEKQLSFEPEGLFRIKKHKRQKYAKFRHKGNDQSHMDFYDKIYAFWIFDLDLELKDLPTLEFYPKYDMNNPSVEILTEIYIPVI